jgi:shikimate dehydrogenase
LGLNWRYVPLPVRPEALGEAVRGLRALGFVGANVTIPHKQAVIDHLGGLSDEAAALGAVNTLVAEGDGWRGENTDVRGFMDDLAAHGVTVAGRLCVGLGAGGAARAVVWGLLGAGAGVAVFNRTGERAVALAREFAGRLASAALTGHELSMLGGFARRNRPSIGLIVNATSVGMWPRVKESPWPENVPIPPEAVVYDLVYRPARTRLLAQAAAAGARPIGGIGMLVRQGAASFEVWTGRPAPVEVMMKVAERVGA